MVKNYLTLNDISAYKISFNLSNYVWSIVIEWDKFAKYTVGNQWARAIDSISANIAEGFGRFGKKDKISFYRIARASVYESLDWLEKSNKRKLITKKEYNYIFKVLKDLPREINSFIKYTNNNLTI
jgi:four helix bundle protein